MFTSIFLYLLCNKSIDKFFFLSSLFASFTKNCHHVINAIDITKKNGNALNKYALNDVIPLFIITIAGKSPIGEEAPPVFDNARMLAKNMFTYFWSIPIAFNRTNIIGKTIKTAVILFKKAETKNISNPNKIKHFFLLPFDITEIFNEIFSIMPVLEIKFVNNSITIRIISTLNW